MPTVNVYLEDAEKDLKGVIQRLLDSGVRGVLLGPNGPVAEITPIDPSSVTGQRRRPPPVYVSEETVRPEYIRQPNGPRIVYSKLTGMPVVTARLGERMITSEEIYEELRGSFP